MQLNCVYSPESETNRIQYTLGKYRWYKENGYRVNLPESLRVKVEHDERVDREEILDAVTKEFHRVEYDRAAKLLSTEFGLINENFTRELQTLGGFIHHTYDVLITKYGVGGSYRHPNKIQVNIDYGQTISWVVCAHEIVHLTIEDWIREYKIDHWTKERIVDLIMFRFFPNTIALQKNGNELGRVGELFDSYFPDIKRIIKELR